MISSTLCAFDSVRPVQVMSPMVRQRLDVVVQGGIACTDEEQLHTLKVSLLERPFDHGKRHLLQRVTDLRGDDCRLIGEAVEDLRFVRRHLTATDDEDATAVDADRDR